MRFLEKVRLVMTRPEAFFSRLTKEKEIGPAFSYLALLGLVNLLLSIVFAPVRTDIIAQMLGVPLSSSVMLLFFLVMLPVLYLLLLAISFIIAGLLHIWILIFGGKARYTKTFQLFVYGRTPSLLLGWIPFAGFVTWIYDVVLLVIGTQKVHKVSRQRAILIYLIPVLVFLLAILFVALLFVWYSSRIIPG